MRNILKIVAILVTLCLTAQAFAFNTTKRVTIASNGKGDLLIFPAYFAGGGWESKVTLVNTSQKNSVVVHMAIRRSIDSAEKDFFIFLPPTDIFTMFVKQNKHSIPVMETSDGSAVIRNDCYTTGDYITAHDGKPFQLELGPGWEMGYIVAVAVAQTDLIEYSTTKDICNNYRKIIGASLPASHHTESYHGVDYDYYDWNVPDNVLTGTIEVYNIQTNARGVIKAFALKDYKNTKATNLGEILQIGVNSENTLAEVNAVLANNHVVIPNTDTGITMLITTSLIGSEAYKDKAADYTIYDTDGIIERSSSLPSSSFAGMTPIIFPDETLGWMLLDYNDYNGSVTSGVAADGVTTISVNGGVPVIHTIMHIILGADNTIQGMDWFYASSQMSNIIYNDTPVSHYAPVSLSSSLCTSDLDSCSY